MKKVKQTNSRLSTYALILGLLSAGSLGISMLSIPSGVMAIITGIVSLRQNEGRTLSVFGIIAGAVSLAISISFLLLGIHGSLNLNIEYSK